MMRIEEKRNETNILSPTTFSGHSNQGVQLGPNFGHINVSVNGQPATKPGKARPLFMVPFDRDRHFVGRRSILDSIESRFKQSRRIALTGIGGVGKSQIAIEYCYKFKESNPQANIFWVYCSTVERFLEAYKNIARRLTLPGWDDPQVNILQMVFEWFNDEDHGTWLFILDSADDNKVFFSAQHSPVEGHEPVALIEFLPRSPNGSIIVTTRDSRIGRRLTVREQPIVISELDLEDACQLLKFKIPNSEDSVKDAHEILERLEYLPLAITHAAAYINENEISVAKYMDMLRADDSELISLLDREELVDHRRDLKSSSSIMQTWKISFDQIQRQHQRAAQVLSLMAILDRHGIPESLLRNFDERESDFIEAIGVLKAYSLINTEMGGKTFVLHRLVQIFTQSWLELQKMREDFEKAALRLLSVKFPSGRYESWELCEKLLPHAQKVLICRFLSENSLLHHATLLDKVAGYEQGQGRHIIAYQKLKESYTKREKLLGKEHPDTLLSMDHLGVVLSSQGKYEEAEELHRQMLKIIQKVVGKEHPDTLTSMNNLASVLDRRGKYEEAEELHRQALELCRKVLGKEHPHTLNSMGNVALVLESRGKYEHAEELYRQTLEGLQRVLGKEHPEKLMSMNNLASILNCLGKHKDAEELHRQTLEGLQRVLGKEHPDTLMSMNNLALVLDSLGKHKDAEELHRQTLEGSQRVLGEEHPDILTSMNNLAAVLNSQGKHKEAEALFRQTVLLYQKVLGKKHPNTLRTMNNLAPVLESQGKYEEAEELLRQTLEPSQKVLGKKHPHTLLIMKNLASVLESQGKHEEIEDSH